MEAGWVDQLLVASQVTIRLLVTGGQNLSVVLHLKITMYQSA